MQYGQQHNSWAAKDVEEAACINIAVGDRPAGENKGGRVEVSELCMHRRQFSWLASSMHRFILNGKRLALPCKYVKGRWWAHGYISLGAG